MPRKNKQTKVIQGTSALTSIIKTSKDQMREVIRGRYIKRGGLNQVASDIRELRKMINTEEKHVDTLANDTGVLNTASLIYALTPPAQGSESNQRTGRSIKVVKIDLIMKFDYSSGAPATTAYQNQIFNWYVVKYLKTPSSNGTTAFGISEFLNTNSGGSNYTPQSLPNPDTNENFQVMASGSVDIALPNVTTVTSKVTRIIPVQIDRAFHQTFNGTTATTITDNCVFVVITAQETINTGGASTHGACCRLWYVDN